MICKTLSDTDGQMENDTWRSQSKKSNKQQIYLPAECVDHNKTGHGDHSHPACKHKMSIKGPVHAVISIVSPVDHWVLNLISGQRLDDLLDIPLRPPSLGEHQLYH